LSNLAVIAFQVVLVNVIKVHVYSTSSKTHDKHASVQCCQIFAVVRFHRKNASKSQMQVRCLPHIFWRFGIFTRTCLGFGPALRIL